MHKPLQKSVAIRLFARFQVIYTHKWMSAIPAGKMYDLAIEEWSERLAGLTVDQIKHGIDNLPADWPPSPLEFRDLCLNDKIDLTHASGAYKMAINPIGVEMSKELREKYANERREKLKKIRKEFGV